jgi:ATP-dependent Clp protease ATP-binding subunit ClpC
MDGYTFTDRSRSALQVAGDEAAALHHDYVGPEHILLALLRDHDSAAVELLTSLGCDLDAIRATVIATVKPGSAAAPAGTLRPYTLRVKKVLEFTMIAARDDGTTAVGTQHLLVGLLKEEKSIAAQALVNAGVKVDAVIGALSGTRLD